jgi:hypothetical protein
MSGERVERHVVRREVDGVKYYLRRTLTGAIGWVGFLCFADFMSKVDAEEDARAMAILPGGVPLVVRVVIEEQP